MAARGMPSLGAISLSNPFDLPDRLQARTKRARDAGPIRSWSHTTTQGRALVTARPLRATMLSAADARLARPDRGVRPPRP